MKSFAESTLAPHSPKMGNTRLSGSDISNDEVLTQVNSVIGAVADQEFDNPMMAVREVRNNLSHIHVGFPMLDISYDDNGDIPEQAVDLYQFGGRYGKLNDDSAEITSDDGIAHKGRALQIKFNFIRNENNKYTVTAKIA